MKITLGFSPCPNDTFIFDALVHHKIDTEGLEFEVVLGDVNQIKSNKFDVIIANINRNILLRDMHFYANALNINGLLLLSGFFSIDKEVLTEEANKLGLTLTFENTKNEWTMLEFVKK